MIATQHNPYSLSQSLARIELNKAEDLYNEMAQHFWPMIGTANQCAYLAMDAAIDAMQEAGIFRQQVKRDAQRAVEEFHKYERLCLHHFKEIEDERFYLWQDLVGHAADKLQPDVEKLFFAIKNKIDSYKVPNAAALARIQTAMAMVSLANLMFDEMVSKFQKQTPVRIADSFKAGRLTASENHWKMVGYLTGKQVLANIDLSHDASCQLGVQVILTRYQAADFLNDAAKEALELNPLIDEKYKNPESV